VVSALLMVDAAATRDRDDAFAVTRVGSGWRVEVHVANVADVVPVAGTADARAFARRASMYRRSGTTPMLGPEVEAATTLVPGVDRRTVRFDIELDHAAAVIKTTLSRSWTQGRAAALTYTAAAAVLADPAAPLHAEVLAAQQLATLLWARRRAAGALAIYDLVHGLATTEEGNLIVLDDQERSNTYMVVAELMILANSVGAVWAAERELPILYRNHRANPVGAAADVVAAEIMAALDDPARLAGVRARLAVTIGRASYDPVVRGHDGLQLPLYTHLTSPLRRWPDLASQRVLLAALDRAPAPYRVDQMAALAADFNRRDTAARAATAAHHQAADHAETLRIAAAAPDLAGLDDGRWHKALKLAVAHTADPPPAVADQLRRRPATPRDLVVLLHAGAGWAGLRTEVFDTAQAGAPELGPSVLSGYLQLVGRTAGYSDEQAGPPHQPVFAAQVIDGDLVTVWRRGGSKKAARQAACWEMLHVLSGTSRPGDPASHPDLPAPRPPTPRPAPAVIDTAGRNPISMLNEYAQRHQLPVPGYTYTADGPGNAPTFTATAAVNQHSAQGVGPTKSIAKTRSAATLLAQLSGAGSGAGADTGPVPAMDPADGQRR
jgi:ribonuclease R